MASSLPHIVTRSPTMSPTKIEISPPPMLATNGPSNAALLENIAAPTTPARKDPGACKS